MYSLDYHPRALKFLGKISKKEARNILRKLETLQKNPDLPVLDTKKLINTLRSYRLRIGKIRIIYMIDRKKKTIFITDIDFRGSIY